MQAIPIHRIIEGLEIEVGDLILVDDESGWRKVHEVVRSPSHAVLRYDGGQDLVKAGDMVSVLRHHSATSMEVC